ncbi:MAG: carbohydrate-binding family 9-like protein [Candidatus Omnitrophica bacterium]|nr:carbohydrate-binding family 9-like protein [Candidatus Omnitrophota bacterium]
MLSGCAGTDGYWEKTSQSKEPAGPSVISASYTEKPIVVDGKLDDAVWSTAAVYNLSLSKNDMLPIEKRNDKRPGIDVFREQGEARLAWDEKYLYVGIRFYDSDIVQENNEDQQHHYQKGDTLEIFLKPEQSTWYWEIYTTPNAKKTVFWYPGRGSAGLPSGFEPGMNLKDVLAGAQVKGTLNKWQDKDEYWTVEMAIPVKGLTARGDSFGPGSEWRILIARYNFSRYLPWRELSMAPQLSITNYHLLEEFGILEFQK